MMRFRMILSRCLLLGVVDVEVYYVGDRLLLRGYLLMLHLLRFLLYQGQHLKSSWMM